MLIKIFSDIYEKAKGPLKQGLLSTITGEAEEKRAIYAKRIAEVKTIWQIDRNVNIGEFYYPTRIDFGGKSRRIDKANDLLISNGIIVEGIAGQGKSMFMRHLCMTCLQDKSYIPVFVQLRHISLKVSLQDLILEAFNTLGITNNKLVIEYFLRSDKLLFLLDGFDEINNEFRSETIRTIEHFYHNYRDIKIIVSSRPNSDIQHSSIFSVTRIKPLNQHDRVSLVNHLVDDLPTKEMLLSALSGKDNITGVLVTPLLVTLLIITYKSESEIPENLSEFYKVLFTTLMKRHDKTKPGYKRQRDTSIGNVEFERVFENLCFSTLNNYKLSMTEAEFHDFVEEALRAKCLEAIDPNSYMDDLVRVTCLVVLDGTMYYYLHKSIPEYFAAQKISEEKNPDIKADFYKKLRSKAIPENWYQTIFFLSEIDEYSYTKELLLPYFYKTFRVTSDNLPYNLPSITEEHFLEIVGEHMQLNIRGRDLNISSIQVQLDSKNWLANTLLAKAIEDTVKGFIFSLSDLLLQPLIDSALSSNNFRYCLNNAGIWVQFLGWINSNSPLKRCYSQVHTLKRKIESQESRARPLFELKF